MSRFKVRHSLKMIKILCHKTKGRILIEPNVSQWLWYDKRNWNREEKRDEGIESLATSLLLISTLSFIMIKLRDLIFKYISSVTSQFNFFINKDICLIFNINVSIYIKFFIHKMGQELRADFFPNIFGFDLWLAELFHGKDKSWFYRRKMINSTL